MKPLSQLAALAFAALAASTADAASYTYVGAWQVYDPAAPVWSSTDGVGNLAYTGQEAAALLFGGTASDYVISTVDNQAADIDFMAWYDVIGAGGNKFAQDYNHKYLGQYYGPVNGYNCCGDDYKDINAASAFVRDNFVDRTNYAFRVDTTTVPVPEPASYALMGLGLALVGVRARRRQA